MANLNYDMVAFWTDEIKSCEERQKKELIQRNLYPAMIDYYEGTQDIDTKKHIAIINEYFPNTNALISELLYQNPDIMANPLKPQAEEGAPIMKAALSFAWDRLDSLQENKLALFDMIYAGYGAVEVNHINIQEKERYDYMSNTQSYNAENGLNEPNIFDKAKEFGKGMIEKFTGTEKEKIEAEFEGSIPQQEKRYATKDETYLRRWNPIDILLDWRAERVRDMRYVIKRIRKSKAEFDAMYPQYAEKIGATQPFDFSQHRTDKDGKSVILYEIQIIKPDDRCVSIIISKDYKSSEIDYFERPYKTNGFNVKIGTLHEYGKLYSISFARVNKAIQDDLNNYMTFMMEVAERNIPKRGYNSNKVNEPGLQALNSNKVNDSVPVDGGSENIWSIPATNVSVENKELIAIFQQHKEKLWNISESRLMGRSKSEFATEMQIQEAGFESRSVSLQQGLRRLIRSELDTLKDIIVQFWDEEYFFKITGSGKPEWYMPQSDPITGRILNPLTDILTADYDIDVDIMSSMRPNKEKKKKDLIEFATWLTSPNTVQFLQMQGLTISAEAIKKVATEWGWNADSFIIPATMPLPEQGAPIA